MEAPLRHTETNTLLLVEDFWAVMEDSEGSEAKLNTATKEYSIDNYIDQLLINTNSEIAEEHNVEQYTREDSLLLATGKAITELVYEGLSTYIYLSRQMAHWLFDSADPIGQQQKDEDKHHKTSHQASCD